MSAPQDLLQDVCCRVSQSNFSCKSPRLFVLFYDLTVKLRQVILFIITNGAHAHSGSC